MPPRLYPSAIEFEPEHGGASLGRQQGGVGLGEVLTHRRRVLSARQPGALLRLQLGDDDFGAVRGVVGLGPGLSRYSEVALRLQFVEVDAHADFMRIASARGPHLGHQAEPGRRDIEAHAKQP